MAAIIELAFSSCYNGCTLKHIVLSFVIVTCAAQQFNTELFTYCACAGFWSRAVGAMSAPPVAVPIPAEHTEMLTYCACAGFWSRAVGAMSAPSVAVPIQPAEHYHLHTKPVPDLPPDTPVVRDPDGYVYFRENEGRFLAGGFEPRVGVPWTK